MKKIKIKPLMIENTYKKKSKLDLDNDGDVDIDDFFLGFKKCIKCMYYMYDVSLDNFPFGSLIGIIMTITACTIITSNLIISNDTL